MNLSGKAITAATSVMLLPTWVTAVRTRPPAGGLTSRRRNHNRREVRGAAPHRRPRRAGPAAHFRRAGRRRERALLPREVAPAPPPEAPCLGPLGSGRPPHDGLRERARRAGQPTRNTAAGVHSALSWRCLRLPPRPAPPRAAASASAPAPAGSAASTCGADRGASLALGSAPRSRVSALGSPPSALRPRVPALGPPAPLPAPGPRPSAFGLALCSPRPDPGPRPPAAPPWARPGWGGAVCGGPARQPAPGRLFPGVRTQRSPRNRAPTGSEKTPAASPETAGSARLGVRRRNSGAATLVQLPHPVALTPFRY
ncbi:translation initiation factor IF-2-like [Dipodomys spectabilis]|uniref:translation initiation factor IF-2-like n=1 Tax=Dipodomys spectabilis TaxID=105255 RepID=UPI001C53DBB6|nr:translation initiation factor IF-2-like [Dipodomys spectabilis]